MPHHPFRITWLCASGIIDDPKNADRYTRQGTIPAQERIPTDAAPPRTHLLLVQELLGHATVAMTLDRYSHVMPGMGEQTAAAMDAALS
jgi:integrase